MDNINSYICTVNDFHCIILRRVSNIDRLLKFGMDAIQSSFTRHIDCIKVILNLGNLVIRKQYTLGNCNFANFTSNFVSQLIQSFRLNLSSLFFQVRFLQNIVNSLERLNINIILTEIFICLRRSYVIINHRCCIINNAIINVITLSVIIDLTSTKSLH